MFYIKKIETIGDNLPSPPALVESITPAYSDLDEAQTALWGLSWDYPDSEIKVRGINYLVVNFLNTDLYSPKPFPITHSGRFTTVYFYIEGF